MLLIWPSSHMNGSLTVYSEAQKRLLQSLLPSGSGHLVILNFNAAVIILNLNILLIRLESSLNITGIALYWLRS